MVYTVLYKIILAYIDIMDTSRKYWHNIFTLPTYEIG